jgi:hypothetical protein
MRHPVALLASLLLLGGVLSPALAGADEPAVLVGPVPATTSGAADPRDLLAEARALLRGEPVPGAPAQRRTSGGHADRELTLVLRDLRLALPRLGAADRREATALLARPTDGRADPLEQGYTAKSVRTCGGRFCVHRVRTGDDRATAAWATTTVQVMNRVWRSQVGSLGYRAPLSDAPLARSRNGGNGKFDVYLKDLGAQGLYGYCAAEFALEREPRRAGGYCVLDNDFSRDEFGRDPADTLAVTAAHEFFHAVQFGYDVLEDRWFMESTATWMEERFADDVDDNRQYLRASQLAAPGTPLDLFNRQGSEHYGNWTWWEHLSARYGNRLVRSVWDSARGPRHSTVALERVLAGRGGFPARYAAFAAANLTPARSYEEGAEWPTPQLRASWRMAAGAERTDTVRLDHLTSASYLAQPDATLGAGWRLRLGIDGPSRGAAPAAWLVVRTADDEWRSREVELDRRGRGSITVGFSPATVRAVSLTVANASTRTRCGVDDVRWACEGRPRDDDKAFDVRAELVQR